MSGARQAEQKQTWAEQESCRQAKRVNAILPTYHNTEEYITFIVTVKLAQVHYRCKPRTFQCRDYDIPCPWPMGSQPACSSPQMTKSFHSYPIRNGQHALS